MTHTKISFVPRDSHRHGVHVSNFILTFVASIMLSYHLGVHSRRYFNVNKFAKVTTASNQLEIISEPLMRTSLDLVWENPNMHGPADIEDLGHVDSVVASTMKTARHFVFDMEAVPEDLIASIDQVKALLQEVVEECGTQILVKECYEDSHSISCVGILEDRGHISLHVWPRSGVALLDVMLPDTRLMDNIKDIYAIFHPNMANYFDIEESLLSSEQGSNWYIRPRASSNYDDDYDGAMAIHGEMKYKVMILKSRQGS